MTRQGEQPQEVQRTEVDGVPVFWAAAPGPLRASLTFRVGQADEDLAHHGLTHLVEHLVLSRSETAPHAYNGSTGSHLTDFVVAGTSEQVTGYLSSVCAGFARLPLERLEVEQRVIRSEAAQRSGGVVRSMTALRWGPVGPGVVAYPEFALEHVNEERILGWSAARFVREASALWLSGPPPEGLALPLPSGEPPPPPPWRPAAPTPFSYTYSDHGFGLSLLVRRGAAGAALGYLIHRRLTDRLRHELGLVYGVEAGSDRLLQGLRHHYFLAECLPQNATAVQEQLCAVLLELRERPPTDAELGDLRDGLARGETDPFIVLGDLEQLTTQHLLGDPPVTRAQFRDQLAALQPDDVLQEALAALDTLVVAVPDGTTVPKELAVPTPTTSERAVTAAETLRPRRLLNPANALLLGDEGVTVLTPAKEPVTVFYDRCSAVLAYPDHVRVLYGDDGFVLTLDPREWFHSRDLARRIDEAVPPQRRVPFDQPLVSAEDRKAQDARERRSKRLIAGWYALAVLLTIVFFPAALWPIIRSVQESRRSGLWLRPLLVGYALLAVAVTAVILWLRSTPPS